MDANTQRVLESVTQKTLHSHSFSRASGQATFVLTDLLSRYLALLTSTCAKYAEHAGRRQLSVHDALQAIDELGTSVEELTDFGSIEGKEMNRYATQTARRAEELHEFRSQLFEGLRQDRDDAIPLQFSRRTEEHEFDSDEDEEDDDDGDEMSVEGTPKRKLSASPVPMSPPKRPRSANWSAPDHIPAFLPPFPSTDVPESAVPSPRLSQPPELPPEAAAAATALSLSQALATTSTSTSSDILVQVPYSESTIAKVPERHLPGPPPPPLPSRPPRLPPLAVEPSFIGAYHHILTHPAPPHPPPSTTQRHKVAMALLDQVQTASRWTPADTLNASVAPCPPRVGTMAPSYPVALTDLGPDGKPSGKEDKTKFTYSNAQPVAYAERMAPMVSQPSSHIPNLARTVLHPAILNRTTRLQHPPVLHRGSKPLVYGSGIQAPWNVAPLPADPATTTSTATPATPAANGKDRHAAGSKSKGDKDDDGGGGKANGGDSKPKPPMPDARLFATWDYEPKDFRLPLASGRGSRSRVGSLALAGGAAGASKGGGSSRSGGALGGGSRDRGNSNSSQLGGSGVSITLSTARLGKGSK